MFFGFWVFLVPIYHLHIFCCELSAQVFCLFFLQEKLGFWLFSYSYIWRGIMYSGYNSYVDMWYANIFFQSAACLFILLTLFFRASIKFSWSPIYWFFFLLWIMPSVLCLKNCLPCSRAQQFSFIYIFKTIILFYGSHLDLWANLNQLLFKM